MVLLPLEFVAAEVGPELLEVGVVLLDEVVAVDDDNVLLVALAGLKGPVERAGHDEGRVNNHVLVVHVESLLRIRSNRDAGIGALL